MRAKGVKWDLFVEYLLEAAAAGVVAGCGWLAKRWYKEYRRRQRRKDRDGK
jgi:hypothetical protein